jgi:hypothetical protein
MADLVWWPEKGYGFQDGEYEYGHDYWSEFVDKQETNIGRALTALRYRLVRPIRQVCGPWVPVLDVGIGGGAFVDTMADALGADVNEEAIHYLRGQNKLFDPSEHEKASIIVTFWDSIEHIKDPDPLLHFARFAVISTPIYESAEHVINSKHYKPGEHLWYFTERGLCRFMAERGFVLEVSNRMEETVGRDGIGTFIFKRTEVLYPGSGSAHLSGKPPEKA